MTAAIQNMRPAAQQGIDAFIADLKDPSSLFADPGSSAAQSPAEEAPASFTDVINALTAAAYTVG